jgi:hypothetical protein
MSTKRFCILVKSEDKDKVTSKTNNKNHLNIPLNTEGVGEPTHFCCFMAIPEERQHIFTSQKQYTEMEYEEPDVFLAKWNLKIIK